jgi:alpha-mannosidase
MRYTTVLDAAAFRASVIGAAREALAGKTEASRDQLIAAFDQLTDARNHFYAVDFYLIDVTLLEASTVGDSLRAKLASGISTSLLATGELLEQLAAEHPSTFAQLMQAISAGKAIVLGGPMRGSSLAHRAPEGILCELEANRNVHQRILGLKPAVYGQFGAAHSPLLPEALHGLGYQAALQTSFDGSRGDRPPQPKTRWGPRHGPAIDILSATPLDVAEPGTWLTLGERIGDTLMRDHVATIVLAGWPGHACEYYEDLRRIAEIAPVLGKFVTLEEYFRLSAEVDDWSTFNPSLYPNQLLGSTETNRSSARVNHYRQHVTSTFDQLGAGLAEVVRTVAGVSSNRENDGPRIALNPWSFPSPRYLKFNPLDCPIGQLDQSAIPDTLWVPQSEIQYLPDVPGCGYASFAEVGPAPPVPLASGFTLHNEHVEAVISKVSGGIQSVRTHHDRTTRVSQRLVMHDRRLPRESLGPDEEIRQVRSDTRMTSEHVEITRNDAVCGEITSRGQLTDVKGRLLATFVQIARVVRGLPIVIVDVMLDATFVPEGNLWQSYFASRLAWRDEAVDVRCGVDWTARPTSRRQIETSEWVEVTDAIGGILLLACGLPFHRLAGPTWLDTLLSVDGETRKRFQFAVGLNCRYPTQTSLALLTAGRPVPTLDLHGSAAESTGWFFHVSAKNVVITHLEHLPAPTGGVRVRILETEGRGGPVNLTAFRPFTVARRTDFEGHISEGLPIVAGGVHLNIDAHRWLQIEAEW